jgi:peptide/nickel transport system ATP-binding protein
VMYAGRMAELASAINVFEKPMHPYTAALMRAFPSIEGEKQDLKGLPGEPPDLLDPPGGCRFHPRCPNARNKCGKQQPPFEEVGTKHYVACWYPLEVDDD